MDGKDHGVDIDRQLCESGAVSTPMPTIRPDAVDHYMALLADNTLPCEALCLTAVWGVAIPDAVLRYDGFPGSRQGALVATDEQVSIRSASLPVVFVDDCDGWTFLLEDNGYHGTDPQVLTALSRDSLAVSVYWNVNRLSRINYAQAGRLLATFDFVIRQQPYGEDPDRIRPYLSGLAFTDQARILAEGVALVEHVTGVRLTRDWLERPHPASVVVARTEFEPSPIDGWLARLAPELAAAASGATRPALRVAAAAVVADLYRATSVTDPDRLGALSADPDRMNPDERTEVRDYLLTTARQAYRLSLELQWDRSLAASAANRIPRLRAEYRRRPTAAAQAARERAELARAYAVGAAFARLHEDPLLSLTNVLANAYRVDRDQFPASSDRATEVLRMGSAGTSKTAIV